MALQGFWKKLPLKKEKSKKNLKRVLAVNNFFKCVQKDGIQRAKSEGFATLIILLPLSLQKSILMSSLRSQINARSARWSLVLK